MKFTFTSAGESHGPQLTVIVTGMPAGVRLDRARINFDLARRQHGYGRGGRMKIEHDEADIVGKFLTQCEFLDLGEEVTAHAVQYVL